MGSQWAGSTRRKRLPGNWPSLRKKVWQRDCGLCQWPVGSDICGRAGRDIDHRQRGDDHSLGNLWVLCAFHHAKKTAAEGNAARAVRRLSGRYPAEKHPGRLA